MSKSGGGKLVRALGLMSGTSLDGIDVALVETDGEAAVRRGPAMTVPYSEEMRRRLAHALVEARAIRARDERPGTLLAVEEALTALHAEAVAMFLAEHRIKRETVDVIGFHGQTVLHRPKDGLTVQLGLGGRLATLTGIPVVFDLRAADIAAGGEGAPLVPVYHRALAAGLPQRPLAVLNIGGVANVTWIGDEGIADDGVGDAAQLIAFDTGPGNALIDDWMQRHCKVAFDEDGQAAARGQVDKAALRFFLSHSFFAAPPPKSLDRNAFALELLDGVAVDDGAATLTRFTVEAVARSREVMPAEPALWVVCGGGRKNRTMMSWLAGRVENAVVPAETVGFDGDGLEAEAWAYLAVRSMKGLAITFPGTTGVPEPLTGGKYVRPRRA